MSALQRFNTAPECFDAVLKLLAFSSMPPAAAGTQLVAGEASMLDRLPNSRACHLGHQSGFGASLATSILAAVAGI